MKLEYHLKTKSLGSSLKKFHLIFSLRIVGFAFHFQIVVQIIKLQLVIHVKFRLTLGTNYLTLLIYVNLFKTVKR